MAEATFDEAVETGGALLFQLVRSLGAVENGEIRCCRVTTGQCLALLALAPEGEATMRQVTAALGVSPGTTTRVVDNLVRDGLVERTQNPDDRRTVCVRPTAEGCRTIKALEECYTRFWGMIFEGIPRARLGDTLETLELLVDAVDRARVACCATTDVRTTRLKEEAPV